MYRKGLLLSILLVLILLVGNLAGAEELFIDGDWVSPSMQPMVIKGQVFVGLRDITDYYNQQLSWGYTDGVVQGWIDYRPFSIKDPTIVEGNLLVPLDFLRQELGLYATWNQGEGRIMVQRGIKVELPFTGDGLVLSLKTDKETYRPNEPIAVSLVILNRSMEPRSLQFNTSQVFDLVLKRGTREIWRWSRDKAFLQVRQEKVLQPMELLQYVILIPAEEIRNLPQDSYTLEAMLTTSPRAHRTDPLVLRVRR